MANFPIDRILSTLNRTGLASKDPALYQVLNTLIDAAKNNQSTLSAVVNAPAGSGIIPPINGTYLTATDQTPYLPQSVQLLAGIDVSFDDTVVNKRTINVSVPATEFLSPFLLMGA